jgi:enamine deaminase RidA (YjgF/YER057c/UK114 family)
VERHQTETTVKIGTALALSGLLLGPCLGPAPAEVVRPPIPSSDFPIAQSVEVSGNTKTHYIGGQVPPVIDRDADPKGPQAYGDTKTQTVGVLNKINDILKVLRLGMGDVVKMQAFLMNDAHAPINFKGFMERYTQFLGHNQPNLPARVVIGVSALAKSQISGRDRSRSREGWEMKTCA